MTWYLLVGTAGRTRDPLTPSYRRATTLPAITPDQRTRDSPPTSAGIQPGTRPLLYSPAVRAPPPLPPPLPKGVMKRCRQDRGRAAVQRIDPHPLGVDMMALAVGAAYPRVESASRKFAAL